MQRLLVVLVAICCLASLVTLMGCSDDNETGSASIVAVSIDPTEASVPVNGTAMFTATVTGTSNTAVTWSVDEENGGTVTQAGLYTAPSTPGTFHVTARSQEDPTAFATATVTVTEDTGVTVTVSPATVTLPINGVQQFTATVTGTDDTSVTWQVVEENGGTIDENGMYIAPGTPGVFHVTAVSNADPTKSGSAEITVTSGQGITMTIQPQTATIPVNGTQQFTAEVTGATNTAVTWSVIGENSGTIDENGLYTAPAIPGTYHIVATSVEDPTITSTATVTVTECPSGVQVQISPTDATLPVNGSTLFTATVTGATDTSVTWSVEEENGGTITADGMYVAPSTAGTFHVTATSVADPTQSATAVVTVTSDEGSIGVSIYPTTATIVAGKTKLFTATVVGTSNTAVTWSVLEPRGGTVTSNGTYFAPLKAGVYHLVATSVADPSQTAIAEITVTTSGPCYTRSKK